MATSYKGIPTIRKRLIGSQLARLRKEAAIGVDDVAEQLGVGPFTVRRQESGETAVSVADVKAYAEVYGVKDEAVLTRLTDLAKHGRVRGWWTAYDATVGPTAVDVADAEDLATGIRTWQPLTVPGLLQTRDYSAAVIEAGRPLSGPDAATPTDGIRDMRERRKEILHRDCPPNLWAIIGEAAILTAVGGADVMRDQLQHLLNLSERSGISIQMMPFAAGAHVGLAGAFMVLSFGDSFDGGIAYMENSGSGAFSDDPSQVRQRADRFAHLQAQALPAADTRRYLLERLR